VESLDKPLEKVLRRLGLAKKIAEKKALLSWAQVCGEDLYKQTKALWIKNGILYVAVKSPAWSQQLSFFKDSIIDRINKGQKKKVIKDIYFLVNSVDAESAPLNATGEEGKKAADYKLTPAEILALRNMVSSVEGENNLKEKYFSLLKKEKLFQKWKEASGWGRCIRCGVLAPPGGSFCPFCIEERQEEKGGKSQCFYTLEELK